MDRDVVDLAADWTLTVEERQLVGNKTGATRLGFAMLLLFFRGYGRFPSGQAELDDEAITFVSQQILVNASELGFYEWLGRSFEYHRAQVRKHFGFRECAVADADKLTDWLTINVCKAERRRDVVTTELLARCRTELLEPPSSTRIDRIVAAALYRAEQALCEQIVARLDPGVADRLQAFVGPESDAVEDSELSGSVLGQVKASAGNVSLESMLVEIDKLAAVKAVGLPADLFADIAPKVVATWRRRAMVELPSHLREHPETLRWTLLAALLHGRRAEIIDALVELLITTVHRIGARAHRRVTEQLVNAFKKVTGKENILFRVAEAALSAPDKAVRDVVFPAVAGGEATLWDLLHEYKTKGPEYRRTVQYSYKASYTNHYRRGLIKLLQALEFRCNNTAHRPVLEALDVVLRYADWAGLTYLPPGELVPEHRGVRGEWEALVYAADKQGRQRVVRSVYEICAFAALRDALRCKEIWVTGKKWRNPMRISLPISTSAGRSTMPH
ncbi:MAG: DUF4158 domain-containing protein [Mycobacteriales bacterium]